MKKDKKVINNLVAKHAPEFCKPKTFRDRKKHPSKKDEERSHPVHEPYVRSKSNMFLDADEWDDLHKMLEEEKALTHDAIEDEEEYPREYNVDFSEGETL